MIAIRGVSGRLLSNELGLGEEKKTSTMFKIMKRFFFSNHLCDISLYIYPMLLHGDFRLIILSGPCMLLIV